MTRNLRSLFEPCLLVSISTAVLSILDTVAWYVRLETMFRLVTGFIESSQNVTTNTRNYDSVTLFTETTAHITASFNLH
jgi:hypothetical protein